MKCPGLHCQGCGDGGGGGLAALAVIVVLVLAAAVAQPVEHAASDVLRVAVETLKIAGIVVASGLGLGALAGGYRLGARVRRQLTARRAIRGLPPAAPVAYVVRPEARRELPVSQPGRPAGLPYRPMTVPARRRRELPRARPGEPPRAAP